MANALGRDPLDELGDDSLTDLLPPRRRKAPSAKPRPSASRSSRLADGQASTAADETPPGHRHGSPTDKKRVTADITASVLDRARAAVHFTPGLTLTALVEKALRRELARREDERGEAFPEHRGSLTPGPSV